MLESRESCGTRKTRTEEEGDKIWDYLRDKAEHIMAPLPMEDLKIMTKNELIFLIIGHGGTIEEGELDRACGM
jgi:hypothetical protein